MKALFVTDLHGAVWKYERLFQVAQETRSDVVINGGDMLPKARHLLSQGDFFTNCLDEHFKRFDTAGIHYLCCLGNDDLRIFDETFQKACDEYPCVVNLAQRKFGIGDFEFVGMNWVVDYPFRLKDRCRMDAADYEFQRQYGTGLLSTPDGWQEIEDWFAYARTLPTIEDELNGLVRPMNASQSIYVIHMPPYKLGLDQCGDGSEVGSKAVYGFLRDQQPRLSLHGHIHESPERSGQWVAQLGDTVCIQPGQLSPLTYVVIDLCTMQSDRYLVTR